MEKKYVIGVDFGTDSVRALVIDTRTGEEISGAVSNYRRWSEGLYCNPSESQFRQHPKDYLESLEIVLKKAVAECPDKEAIMAIGVDTTASTPGLIDENCVPLAMREEFSENPDAMFVLWKDHTAQQEAYHLQDVVDNADRPYLLHSGNHSSAETFWPKIFHILRNSPEMQPVAKSCLEFCDWIPAVLAGISDLKKVPMSHCGANVKRLYSPRWGGFPKKELFDQVDRLLFPLVENMPEQSACIVDAVGKLSEEWAEKIGLTIDVVVCTGIIDSYAGAIGAGVREGSVVMNLGTSQCQMAVRKKTDATINGVFGEADDSILVGFEGLEAGVSAFGDLYAWYKRILSWPMQRLAKNSDNEELKKALEEAQDSMIADLSEEALKLNVTLKTPLATDYINGRRSPAPQNSLTGALMGFHISTTAPELFYAFAEASAFATKAVLDLYIDNGVEVNRLIAIGGIALKSPLVCQLIADLTQFPVEVSASKNSCALGAAINAAVAAGIYRDAIEAQDAMCPEILRTYYPNPDRKDLLGERYIRYKALGDFTELVWMNK